MDNKAVETAWLIFNQFVKTDQMQHIVFDGFARVGEYYHISVGYTLETRQHAVFEIQCQTYKMKRMITT